MADPEKKGTAAGIWSRPVTFSATAGFWAVTLGLSVLLVLAITSVDYVPTSDGPQRLLAGYLLNHLDDGERGYNQLVVPAGTLTDLGFEVVFARLEPLLGWRAAFQTTLCLIVLLWSWGILALAASLGSGLRWLGLVGFASAFQWSFYMGQFSFLMGMALGFFVLALAFRRQPWTTLDRLGLAGLLLAQVIVHAFSALLIGAVLTAFTVLSMNRSSRWRALATLGLIGLPAVCVAVATLVQHLSNVQAASYNYPPTPLVDRAILLGRGFVSGPAWRAWPAVGFAALGALMGARLLWAGLPVRERTLLLCGLLFTGAGVFLPLHLHSWEFFCVRFTPYGIVFLVLVIPLQRRPGHRVWRVALVGALLVHATGSIAWAWEHHVRLRRASASLLAGLEVPLARKGLRLPLILEPPPGEDPDEWRRDVPYAGSNWHLGALYAIQQGGLPVHMFAGLTGQLFRWRGRMEDWAPPRPERGQEWRLWEPEARRNPTLRQAALAYYLSFAPPYEDTIFQGGPDDVLVLKRRGFIIDYQREGFAIARFRGCRFSVQIQPPPRPVSTLIVSGWMPSSRPTFSLKLAPAVNSTRVDLPGSPCGEVWVRVLFDFDGDGQPSVGDGTCVGASRAGYLIHDVRQLPSGDSLRCQPGDSLGSLANGPSFP